MGELTMADMLSGPPDPNANVPVSIGQQSAGGDPNLAKSLNTVELKPDDITKWQARIKASEERTKALDEPRDILLNEYLPVIKKSGEAETAKTNAHFRNVQTKMGQLFVRSPLVILSPKESAKERMTPPAPPPMLGPDGFPMPAIPQPSISPSDALPVRQAVINEYMGPEFIDGAKLMDECVFDVLAWAGQAWVKVSYTAVSKPVQRPVMQPDPNWQPPAAPMGSVLGLPPAARPPQVPVMVPHPTDPTQMVPQMQTIQVPVYQKWDADRGSPKKLLLDDQLRSCRVEKHSRWIGHRFYMDIQDAVRKFGVDPEQLKPVTKDERLFTPDQEKSASKTEPTTSDMISGVEVFYLGVFFLADEWHPLAMYQLVFLDNINDRPVISRKSPDQTFDETGQLTDDSLVGFPIKVLMTRMMADYPFPVSDSGFTNSNVKLQNTFRRQSILLRDAAIGKYFYDTAAIDVDDKDKMQNGEVGTYIGLKAGALAQGADKIFMTTAQVRQSPDDVRTEGTLKQEIDETLGISAVQAGSPLDTVRSATEIAAVQADSSGRQEKEKAACVSFYLEVTRAVDTLLFRYAQGNRYVKMVGPQGVAKLQMWNKQLGAGCYSYAIKVNSQLNDDITKDRQSLVNGYNVVGPDPLTNRAPWLRLIATSYGLDPAEAVKDEAVVNAEQAAQAMGQFTGQPAHPNAGPINKHTADKTGQLPNGPGTHGAPPHNPTPPPPGPSAVTPGAAPQGGVR
jgi:hypothetical protein